MVEKIIEKTIKDFIFEEFDKSQVDKYRAILKWMEQKQHDKDVQLLSFIARSYKAIGMKIEDEELILQAEKIVNNIRNQMNDDGYFGDQKEMHRTYFALIAIKEIEGKDFNKDKYQKTIDWVKKRVNADNGWSQSQIGKAESDVETTSCAIQLLSLLMEGRKADKDLKKLIENGVNWLVKYRGKKMAWGEYNLPLDVHSTSHAIRAIIAASPFLNRNNEIRQIIKNTLSWLEKTQIDGGWGTNEAASMANICDTSLGFITLNRINQFDSNFITPYYICYVNTLDYIWTQFKNDHWSASGKHKHLADSLQSTARLTQELSNVEWKLKDVSYYIAVQKIHKKLIDHEFTSSPLKRKLIIIIRATGLISLIFIATPSVILYTFSGWILLENFVGTYSIASNIIASAISYLMFLFFPLISRRNPKKLIKDYLGLT